MPDKAVLLLNLGSPDSPSIKDVRRYLNQFLMDPDVIDLPWIFRRLLVSLLILPFRSSRSAHAYSLVWTDKGSPLLVNSLELTKKVQATTKTPVYLAMRYGSPSIHKKLNEIRQQYPRIKKLRVIPLYPHYAGSTFASCCREVELVCSKLSLPFEIETHPPFYADSNYIKSLIDVSKPSLSEPHDHVLFSYHGLPERHLRKDDPTKSHCMTKDCCFKPSLAHKSCYRYQVLQTTKAFAEKVGLSEDQYTVTFQSRLGKAKWLEPFTESTLVRLAKAGKKRVVILCPSFTADCLETLEEINMQAKKTFKAAGGEKLIVAPCLNSHPAWVNVISQWVDSPVKTVTQG